MMSLVPQFPVEYLFYGNYCWRQLLCCSLSDGHRLDELSFRGEILIGWLLNHPPPSLVDSALMGTLTEG